MAYRRGPLGLPWPLYWGLALAVLLLYWLTH